MSTTSGRDDDRHTVGQKQINVVGTDRGEAFIEFRDPELHEEGETGTVELLRDDDLKSLRDEINSYLQK